MITYFGNLVKFQKNMRLYSFSYPLCERVKNPARHDRRAGLQADDNTTVSESKSAPSTVLCAELILIQPGVNACAGEQLFVGAPLSNALIVEHDDLVGIFDG